MGNLSGTRTTAALLQARAADITTPGAMNLAALQQAVNQTRARFVRLEQLVNRLYDLLDKSGGDGASTANSLSAQLATLAAQIAALEGATGVTPAEDEGPPGDTRAMQAIAELAKRVEAIESGPRRDSGARQMIQELTKRVSALEEAP